MIDERRQELRQRVLAQQGEPGDRLVRMVDRVDRPPPAMVFEPVAPIDDEFDQQERGAGDHQRRHRIPELLHARQQSQLRVEPFAGQHDERREEHAVERDQAYIGQRFAMRPAHGLDDRAALHQQGE